MAFLVNSVGHLVKSGQLSKVLRHLDEALGGPEQALGGAVVDSHGKSLDLAMRTIGLGQDSPSGKATMLLALPDPAPVEMPPCPIALPKVLAGKDHTTYGGWYHTDVTIPSEFFRPDVERPTELELKQLDFTYLFHDDIDNPDHLTIGKGRRVRAAEDVVANPQLSRMVAESVVIADQPVLRQALARRENHGT